MRIGYADTVPRIAVRGIVACRGGLNHAVIDARAVRVVYGQVFKGIAPAVGGSQLAVGNGVAVRVQVYRYTGRPDAIPEMCIRDRFPPAQRSG